MTLAISEKKEAELGERERMKSKKENAAYVDDQAKRR